jgi:hypothetical protein
VRENLAVFWMRGSDLRDWEILTNLREPQLARELAAQRRRGRGLVKLAMGSYTVRDAEGRFMAIFAPLPHVKADQWIVGASTAEWTAAQERHAKAGLVPRTFAVNTSSGRLTLSMVWGARRERQVRRATGRAIAGRGWSWWEGLPSALPAGPRPDGVLFPHDGLTSWWMHGEDTVPVLGGLAFEPPLADMMARGASGRRSTHPQTAPELEVLDLEARGKGQRMFDLETWRGTDGTPRFLGRWERTSSAAEVETEIELDLDVATLWQHLSQWTADGWSLVDLEIDSRDGVSRGHAVWSRMRSRAPGGGFRVENDIRAEAAASRPAGPDGGGWLITNLEPYFAHGELRLALVWQPAASGTVSQSISMPIPEDRWEAEVRARDADGWVPFDVERVPMPHGDVVIGLWLQGLSDALPRAFEPSGSEPRGRFTTSRWSIDLAEAHPAASAGEPAPTTLPRAEHVEGFLGLRGVRFDRIRWASGMAEDLGRPAVESVGGPSSLESGAWTREDRRARSAGAMPWRYDLCPDEEPASVSAVTIWCPYAPGTEVEIDDRLPASELPVVLSRRRKERWEPVDLDVRPSAPSPQVSIVWRRGPGRPADAWDISLGLDATALATWDAAQQAKGRTLERLEAHATPSGVSYGGIWVAGRRSLETALDLELDFQSWRAAMQARDVAGWIPTDLCRTGTRAGTRLSTLWIRRLR